MTTAGHHDGAQPTTPEQRLLVWVLEDSPMEAAMARRALSPLYDVELFSDGSTLIERISEGRTPAVLVLDLQLPGISGIEVCRFLRSRFNETALPVLMLTVYGHKSDLIEGLGAGANDYLTKPYDPPELMARVSTLARINLLFEAARRAEGERQELYDREREARREAEAANAAKDEFLAMVSHELRTPLNAILGWTRMLRTGNLGPDQQQRALDTVERNALAQAQLIEDLLDMARIISGKLTIGNAPVELVTVIHRALDAVRHALEAKQILVEPHIHSDGAMVLGDDVRLQQVVWNLLSNAIKFSPKGGRIVLGLERIDNDVELSVSDAGRGIEPAFLPHVFERFRQGEDGSKRTHAGLGLGLAIVKFIAGLHGGSVSAESEGQGKGATFRVRLPRFRSSSVDTSFHARSAGSMAEASTTGRLTGLRVLVVDDDADGLELIAAMLRRDGAEVRAEPSADAALAQLPEWRPDVLVSDIGMPSVDGYELIRRLRGLTPDQGGRTPALALTAFAHPQDRTRALSAGFNIYVPKPVDPFELAVSVANLAGRFPGG
jgi:signal transduction histidine kinase